MANKKIVRGQDTISRIETCWQEVLDDPDDRPSVSEFAQRVKIANTTLYRLYPEWAEKIRLRRDENLETPRRYSPATKKQQQKEVEVEALKLVEKLRRDLLTSRQELQAMHKDRDRWKRLAQEAGKHREMNERLRAVIQRFGTSLKKYLDASKAQDILNDMSQFQERHLQVIKGSKRD
jgi:hypothetical protein